MMADQAELMRLLQATACGDQIAFRQLYEKTSPALMGLCMRMLKDRASAEEVLQEAFVKIWYHASEYHEERGKVSTWLTSIVRYRALDFLRARHPQDTSDELLPENASEEPGPLRWAVAGDEMNALQLCLEQLSGEQKQLIVLSFIEGLTHQELMQRVESPLGTIKSWIRRGLQSLRRCLEP
ncbi:sigma-70 family RNA polymerase sigma factor [Ketobacter nezhaii]|uniref:sigma-70 family RNA polymerase sigma factor n=1 Tax=Ketobacter sp. MCCC 1A13808 TaxID=2602738 RepID=UPI0018DD07EB|nr:sigma-70 family RNA polymerase sigma factor [Ketobacter sp. MCCC 1A13808]